MPSDSLAGFQNLNMLNKHFDKHCVIIGSHVLFSLQKDNLYSCMSTTSQYNLGVTGQFGNILLYPSQLSSWWKMTVEYRPSCGFSYFIIKNGVVLRMWLVEMSLRHRIFWPKNFTVSLSGGSSQIVSISSTAIILSCHSITAYDATTYDVPFSRTLIFTLLISHTHTHTLTQYSFQSSFTGYWLNHHSIHAFL